MTDEQQSFDEFITSVMEAFDEGDTPLESVDDLLKADYAIERIGKLKQEIENAKDFMRRKVETTKQWYADRERKLSQQIEWYEGQLRDFILANRDATGDNRISTEAGRAYLRSSSPQINWDDEQVVEYLESAGHGDLIRKAPDKTAIKKRFKIVGDKLVSDDGEVLEGVEVEQDTGEILVVSPSKKNAA